MIRATMLFAYTSRLGRAGGWSESWYIDADYGPAKTALASLMPQRALLLNNQIQIVGQRYQKLFTDQVNGGKSVTGNVVVPGASRSARDVPQMALLCTVSADGQPNQKRYALRGFFDDLVVEGDLSLGNPTQASFNAFANSLRTNNFRFRALDSAAARVGIVSIAADGTFVLAGDLAYNVDDYLTLLRVKATDNTAISGSFRVAVKTDARNGRFSGWGGKIVGQVGSARKRVYIYPTLLNGSNEILRVIVRKVGRPFALYRGRATKTR